jgi:hypothetical protein
MGIPAILSGIKQELEMHGLPGASSFLDGIDLKNHLYALQSAFIKYCGSLNRPFIIFFDEADCLSGSTLISFLRQLRNGYVNRSDLPFIHSLALIGMRNIRDYRSDYRSPEQTLGTASPFNITTTALSLRNFTQEEIIELYAQHTEATGTIFTDEAAALVFRQTQGQPWLVNAIAREAILNKLPLIDTSHISAAIQTLILRRDTHFDSLMARLQEERVRRIIEPVITGDMGGISVYSDDYRYVRDMGLIRDDRGKIEPANPIYGEVIVRTLNVNTQYEMEQRGVKFVMPRYLRGGIIDMDYLLRDFQSFWRENADIWKERYDYKEATPQLILQAFLQRVLNGGGQIIREMAAATGRVDLCVVYLGQKYPIELKIRRSGRTREEGLEQLAGYMEVLGCKKGWLVIFDERPGKGTGTETLSVEDERFYAEQADWNGAEIGVYGA